MTMVENLKNIYCRFSGRFYVSPEIIELQEKKILHISDTPTNLYSAIQELLDLLTPDVVVHTGDLADNIKLEFEPDNLDCYSSAIVTFLKILEHSPAERIFLVPGNHDNTGVIYQNVDRTRIMSEGDVITVNGVKLGLALRMKRLPGIKGYNLYGHDFSRGDGYYLNGIENVNVILSSSGRVIKIPYPLDVNCERKMENAYGIPGAI